MYVTSALPSTRPWQIMSKNQTIMLCSYGSYYALQYILLTDFKLPCDACIHVQSLCLTQLHTVKVFLAVLV